MPDPDLVHLSPQALVRFLRERRIRRFHLAYVPAAGELRASHACLQPLADFLAADRRDFLQHEGMFFQVSRRHETLQGAFVHCTRRGQAAGGVRYWHYDTVEGYLRDGMRLAVGMTRKNALAGLWWGGGKGVMAQNPAVERDDPAVRRSLYQEYGELMTALDGCYVTAEDVGTGVDDMAAVFSRTRFTTCIPPSLGGSGNPSVPTARGVIAGLEAALEFLGDPGLADRTVAVQGLGNVGRPLVGFLLARGVQRVIGHDVDAGRVARVTREHPGDRVEARLVEETDESIFEVECDVLAPCATGGVLNPRTIEKLKARVVCGAANNQLEDPDRDDGLLQERGVLYVPDFLTNRMGIVNCANEDAGRLPGDPLVERHLDRDWEHSIHRTCLEVLERSRQSGDPPSRVATRRADELAQAPHPIFGHRGQEIIDSLTERKWYQEPTEEEA